MCNEYAIKFISNEYDLIQGHLITTFIYIHPMKGND